MPVATGLIKRIRLNDKGRVVKEKVVGQCDGEKLADDAARVLATGFARWLDRKGDGDSEKRVLGG